MRVRAVASCGSTFRVWLSVPALAVAAACSAPAAVPGNAGGTSAHGGSSAEAGGTATGGRGGNSSSSGGAAPAGGAANGGALGASGAATKGGASAGGSSNTGGSTSAGRANGGTSSGGATTSNGGSSPGGSSPGGATGTCGGCGSHKWACFKMPNPASSGLPNPASYTTANGVVHDNVTCLDWEASPPSTTASNADAIARCEALELGGFGDWRAPTRVEMASILDWTRSPATDAAFGSASGFHKTGSNWVLTIDQRGAGAGKDFAWAYNLSDGIVSNARSAATADRIRCVRGNGSGEGFNDKPVTLANQYTVVSSDEVTDNYTGLTWQRDGNASGLLGWDAAVAYCQELTLGGQKWRLPSIRELATLVDEAQVGPAINRAMFPNTHYGSKSNNWYWAAHRARSSSTASWGLNFDDGFTGTNTGASGDWNYWTEAYAKCVR